MDNKPLTVGDLRRWLEGAPDDDAPIRCTLGQTDALVLWEAWPSDDCYRITFREVES